MNIGNLNKRIKIQKYDKDNGDTSVIHECWAQVNNQSGKDIIQNNTEMNKVSTRFLIRYTKKIIDSSMEIAFNKQIYNIEYVNDYGFSHEFIEILATHRGWDNAS